jgi:hypothetical protein
VLLSLQVPEEAVEKLNFLLTRQDPLLNSFSSHSVNPDLTSAPPLSYIYIAENCAFLFPSRASAVASKGISGLE